MSCEIIRDKDGTIEMIVCQRGCRIANAKCQVPGCVNPHAALCDFPLTGAALGKTCDLKLCRAHAAKQPGNDRDFCPVHAAVAEKKEVA
jgi:hypothetical protein